jgi:hypothetical protein
LLQAISRRFVVETLELQIVVKDFLMPTARFAGNATAQRVGSAGDSS